MFQQLLCRIARALDRISIPYMVIGGQSVAIHGHARLTEDIDVTLGAGPERWTEIQDVAEQEGWTLLPRDPSGFVSETLVLPCRDEESGIRIDFIFSFSPYEQKALGRAVSRNVGGYPVHFAAVEDLVIHKVVAGRPRDLDDVRAVYLKNSDADWDYVTEWLRQFETALGEPLMQRFEQIRSECDLGK